VLKLAESYGCPVITSLLPYLLWIFAGVDDVCKCSIISKWFKPAVWQQAKDACWDPQEKCVKNTSNMMLTLALDKYNVLYWEQDDNVPNHQNDKRCKLRRSHLTTLYLPSRQQWAQRNQQNLCSTTTGSTSPNDGKKSASNSAIIMSHRITLSQLMEQVSEIKHSHKTILVAQE